MGPVPLGVLMRTSTSSRFHRLCIGTAGQPARQHRGNTHPLTPSSRSFCRCAPRFISSDTASKPHSPTHTLDVCVPILRCTLAHCTHRNMPARTAGRRGHQRCPPASTRTLAPRSRTEVDARPARSGGFAVGAGICRRREWGWSAETLEPIG